MKWPIDGIEAFICIADCQSFHKAAEKLFITQTGLTRRLRRLEDYVDVRLVDRTTRYIGLTSAGRDFLPQAVRVLQDLTGGLDRLRTMSRLSSGDVTIACLQSLASFRLAVALRVYGDLYPANRVRVLERTGALATEAVRHGMAEFGLHIMQKEQVDLHQELLISDPLVLFCLQDHPVAALPQVTWSDLAGMCMISLGGASGNQWAISEQLAKVEVDLEGRYVVENFASAVALVAAGLGVAVLPASLAVAHQNPSIRQVPLVDPTIYRSVGLVRRHAISLTPAAQALYDLFRRELGNTASVAGNVKAAEASA